MPKVERKKRGKSNHLKNRYNKFIFVTNNYTPEKEAEIKAFAETKNCRYMIFGHEIAPSTGTPHLQGYCQLYDFRAYNPLQEIFRCIKPAGGDEQQNKTYCSKDATDIFEYGIPCTRGQRTEYVEYVDAIKSGTSTRDLDTYFPGLSTRSRHWCKRQRLYHRSDINRDKVEKNIGGKSLLPWQLTVLDRFEKQNDRQVTWVADTAGKSGKSFLVKYLRHHRNNVFTHTGGPEQKIADKLLNTDITLDYVIFDLSRSTHAYPYHIIEKLKDGVLDSVFYEGGEVLCEDCKVLVLANDYPDLSMLTADRWDIIDTALVGGSGVSPQDTRVFSNSDFV